MKPKFLKETTILMCILNVAGYLFINPQSKHLAMELLLGTIIVLFSYVVLWFYWCGKNWARILVILTSALSLFNLLGIAKHNPIQAALIVVEAMLGLYLLWWLNTSAVKSYFAPKN